MLAARRKAFLKFALIGMLASKLVSVSPAMAQIVIPHGSSENAVVKYLVALIAAGLLLLGMRHSYRNGQLDYALSWFSQRVRKIFKV